MGWNHQLDHDPLNNPLIRPVVSWILPQIFIYKTGVKKKVPTVETNQM